MPTAARILQLAPTACYLAGNDVNKKSLFGKGSLVPTQAIKIYNVYKILKHVYDKDPDYDGMQERCNYLYELLKRWALQAAAIVDGGGGGSVAPVTPGGGTTLPLVLDFLVGSGQPIEDGGTGILLDGTGGNYDYRGFNLSFDRNGQPQYTTDPSDSSTYFSWNRTTGQFLLLNGNAIATERFRLTPIG